MMQRTSIQRIRLLAASVLPALLSVLALAFATGSRAQVPPPNPAVGDGRVSSFYTWSASLPARPGKMLRTEPLPAELGLANASRQVRILYTSTDGVSGKGIVAVSGAIFVPRGRPPAGGWPIIAWAHGTVGVADICAPSWAARSYRDVRYLNAWLAQGYAVVATDYQGLGTPGLHPYLNTRPEAYSVLDAVRAGLAGGFSLRNRVVVVGQSQGGGAALATAGFAGAYASDVRLMGVVATGVPNLTLSGMAALAPADPNRVDRTISLLFYTAIVAQQIDPTITADTFFTPEAAPLLDRARISCHGPLESDVVLAGLTRAGALKPSAVAKGAVLIAPRLAYPTLKFTVPVFVGTGDKDDETPPQQQLLVVQKACAAGTVVELHVYRDQSHSGTVNLSLTDSLPFVAKVFAGERINSTCGQATPQT